MNSSLTNSVKPLSSVQSCPFCLFPKTLYIKLDVCVSFYSSVDTLYSHHAWQCVWLVNLYSTLLEASVNSPKAALWRTPRWQDLWQTARWQDLQVCEMLHLIKTTKVCGWAEQRAGVLTAYCFHFLFSVWVLLTPTCFKKNALGRGLCYEIIIYMLNVIYQICFPTC